LGKNPVGFGEPIVILTAVHFHYAAFAAPLLTGFTGRVLNKSSLLMKRIYSLVAIGVITGTPILAAGITLSSPLEFIGAGILAVSLFILGIILIFWIAPKNLGLTKILLGISGFCVAVAMVLAMLYAWGMFQREIYLTIPQMAISHGILNAFGFSLCGLLGYYLAQSKL